MKRIASIFTCLILSASLFAAPSGDGWKSRKKLRNENDRLKTQIAALEAELAAYRQEAAVRESITEELSGENENKVSAALEDYTTANTDSLLGRWYMHRSSKYGSREQYNMDSVRFTTDVPDSVLMRRLEEYCDEAGQTKTMAVERIVAAFLDERNAKKDGGETNNGNNK